MKEVIYLAHSVRERGMGKRVQKRLEDLGYEIYNPFYPIDPRAYRTDIKALDEGLIVPWDVPDRDSAEWIIKVDLRAVGNSDIIVCIFPNKRTVGIPCEMMFAWMRHISILTVVPGDMKGHPWIVGMADKVFTDIEELYEYLGNEE